MNISTICAVATAPGGAISIVRISGPNAISVTSAIFFPNAGISLEMRKSNTITYGQVRDTENNEIVDEVLVSIFRAPHSYTGENSAEISCHGSRFITNRIVQMLLSAGCEMAKPGEFTERAFLNGKMDLSQAEAVADLIASSSSATHRMAMSQIRGDFSKQLSSLRDKLLKLTSLMELELDFSDHEELEFADRSELKSLSREIETVISRLARSFTLGNALKNGVPVAIVGETNAGKSTLLNTIVGEEKAIVSDIHGTTRDVIEDTVNINGIVFRFIDTAGIRDTNDKIENLGIERTFKKISEAQIVLWVIDATCAETQIVEVSPKILPLCQDKHLLLVFNKADMLNESAITHIESLSTFERKDPPYPIVVMSAQNKMQVENLLQILSTTLRDPQAVDTDIIVSNLRHYEALTRALAAIRRVEDGLATQLPTDLISQDLRECLSALAEITGGAITTQETLTNIFSHFCIGK